jgi:hypothetical protein
MILLSVRVWRERESGVQKVSQIQKVHAAAAALGDMYLPGADLTPKTDEGGRAMMGWIYFAEDVAPGRILLWEQSVKYRNHRKKLRTYFASAESVSPRCQDYIAAPLVRNLANNPDPLKSTSLPGFFASYPGPSMYYCVSMFFATEGRRSLYLRRDWGPTVRGVLFAHCCAEHVGQHVCSADCSTWSTKDVDLALSDSLGA